MQEQEVNLDKIISDIMNVYKNGNDEETLKRVCQMQKVFNDFLFNFSKMTDGYMFMIAFVASFAALRSIAKEANPEQRRVIEGVMIAVIGSFGSTIQ